MSTGLQTGDKQLIVNCKPLPIGEVTVDNLFM